MEVIRSQTNSANDSEGSVWGLPGNTFLALVFALIVSITTLIVLYNKKLPVVACVVVAATPTVLTIAYIGTFIVGKPRHYDRDYADLLVTGQDLEPNSIRQPPHPLDLDQYDRVDRPKRIFRR